MSQNTGRVFVARSVRSQEDITTVIRSQSSGSHQVWSRRPRCEGEVEEVDDPRRSPMREGFSGRKSSGEASCRQSSKSVGPGSGSSLEHDADLANDGERMGGRPSTTGSPPTAIHRNSRVQCLSTINRHHHTGLKLTLGNVLP